MLIDGECYMIDDKKKLFDKRKTRMKQHGHGADVLEVMKRYGIENLLDYSSNVNIFLPSRTQELIQKVSAEAISQYPDIHYTELREKLSVKYGVDAKQIIVGNGSTELIFLIARSADRIGIINPTFGEYQRAAEIFGKEIVHFYYEDDFSLDIARMDLQDVDVLFVCNPNNPSGNTNSLLGLLDEAKATGTVLVVDETFMDFVETGEYSLMSQIGSYSNLIVVKAITKFYAMTGVRLGYAFGSREVIEALWMKKEPWSVNVFAEKLIDAIFDEEFEERSRSFFKEEILWMKTELERIPNVKIYPTQSNFFLIELPDNVLACEMKERMILHHHILIRDCSNYKGLSQNHIRVNIKTRKENGILIEALKKELSQW